MQSDPPPLLPTWTGHVATTMDALILFEACLQGRINHLSRRPYDRERLGLIQSGNVFIYEEFSSGIRRWTDGRHWSPSRVLGNFLVYRELRNAFQPGTTRKVTKPRRAPYSERRGSTDGQTDAEYALIGPLVDSYPFKTGGLVKKIIRAVLNGVPHHLVAYYTLEDVENGRLTRPGWDPAFCNAIPRPELLFQESFRVPVDQEKDLLGDGAEWFPEVRAIGPLGSDGFMPPALAAAIDLNYHGLPIAPTTRPQPLLTEGSYPPGTGGGGYVPQTALATTQPYSAVKSEDECSPVQMGPAPMAGVYSNPFPMPITPPSSDTLSFVQPARHSIASTTPGSRSSSYSEDSLLAAQLAYQNAMEGQQGPMSGGSTGAGYPVRPGRSSVSGPHPGAIFDPAFSVSVG